MKDIKEAFEQVDEIYLKLMQEQFNYEKKRKVLQEQLNLAKSKLSALITVKLSLDK